MMQSSGNDGGAGEASVALPDNSMMEYKKLFRQKMDLEGRYRALAVLHADKCIAISNIKNRKVAPGAAAFQPSEQTHPQAEDPAQTVSAVARAQAVNPAADADRLYCELCDVRTNAVIDMKHHLMGAKHLRKLQQK